MFFQGEKLLRVFEYKLWKVAKIDLPISSQLLDKNRLGGFFLVAGPKNSRLTLFEGLL